MVDFAQARVHHRMVNSSMATGPARRLHAPSRALPTLNAQNVGVDIWAALGHHRRMLGETQKQSSLTRGAFSNAGGQKQILSTKCRLLGPPSPVSPPTYPAPVCLYAKDPSVGVIHPLQGGPVYA